MKKSTTVLLNPKLIKPEEATKKYNDKVLKTFLQVKDEKLQIMSLPNLHVMPQVKRIGKGTEKDKEDEQESIYKKERAIMAKSISNFKLQHKKRDLSEPRESSSSLVNSQSMDQRKKMSHVLKPRKQKLKLLGRQEVDKNEIKETVYQDSMQDKIRTKPCTASSLNIMTPTLTPM